MPKDDIVVVKCNECGLYFEEQEDLLKICPECGSKNIQVTGIHPNRVYERWK